MGWAYWRKVIFFFSISALSGAGLVAVGTYGEGFAKDDDKSPIYLVGMSLAMVAVLGTFVENHLAERARTKARERAIKAETELALLCATVLPKVAAHIRAQASRQTALNPPPPGAAPDPTMTTEFDSLVRTVLEASVNLTIPPVTPLSPARARSAYYELDSAGDFQRVDFYPPNAAPPRQVIPGTGTGGTHIRTEILDPGQLWVVDGTTSRISHLLPTSANSYTTVIAAPVVDGTRQFGMLAVDASEPERFAAEHLRLIEALATLLVAGRVPITP
ncbi:GAF domain-containing protein [Streptomyces sp. NPDC093071]|uniref:GAF domain-containing protein n=1 Tax=Streptomyces sp. NPDC093071 TaxID=3366022 RepID=UPI003800C873